MEEILTKVRKLIKLYQEGALGGEIMPEDSNPHFDKGIEENYFYFTLPMALNYQRNSYKLWESALETWKDNNCQDIFYPMKVVEMDIEQIKNKLVKYKIALQQNKQPLIWKKLCDTFSKDFDGSVKNLFEINNNDIVLIKNYITQHKKDFPYLSGAKILNYWLYVMSQYTSTIFKNCQEITIAPDTHVLQASIKLGIINQEDLKKSNIRELVSDKWKQILNVSGINPIDIHTPFWLWSRNGFVVNV